MPTIARKGCRHESLDRARRRTATCQCRGCAAGVDLPEVDRRLNKPAYGSPRAGFSFPRRIPSFRVTVFFSHPHSKCGWVRFEIAPVFEIRTVSRSDRGRVTFKTRPFLAISIPCRCRCEVTTAIVAHQIPQEWRVDKVPARGA